jgi:4-diphosphocytidyl-2-C-methyl-D-erythritol kinase
MNRTARVIAQAKVNLVLRILAREQSGYHSIETVFLRLELGDDVVVRVGDGVRGRAVECSGVECPPAGGLGPMDQNLAYRAAVAFAGATGWPSTFAIAIDKRVPVGGGLGGGSADAGAVLRALDALAPNPLRERLLELASEIGADVSFLTLESAMALAWGRGQRLLPLPVLDARPVVIVVPPFGVATADAYDWLAHARSDGAFVSRSAVLAARDLAEWEGIARLAENELEPVVTARHPEIGDCVERLRSFGAIAALMTGSGSAVFGVFADDGAAKAAAARLGLLLPKGSRILVTRTAENVARVQVG